MEGLYCLPASEVGAPKPELAAIRPPYRFVITPILDYVFDLQRQHLGRRIAVVVPNLSSAGGTSDSSTISVANCSPRCCC
jgi:hypothetical protein